MKRIKLLTMVWCCWALGSWSFNTDDKVDGGTLATPSGATEVYTCPGDGIMDQIEIIKNTTANQFYTFVITDEQGTILACPVDNVVDFEGAGVGVCRVYGVSFTGTFLPEIGDNFNEVEEFSSGKSDVSDNSITVFRDTPEAGMVSTPGGLTMVYTTPGDGEADVVMAVTNSEVNSKFALIVTDDQNNVLGLPPGNSVDFEEAGAGVCRIYGVSFTGMLEVELGDNLDDLDGLSNDCSDLSDNYITVIRTVVDGGMVATPAGETTVYTCPGDGVMDVVEAVSTSESTANYAIIVTDSERNVLGLPPGLSVDLEGAGVGICRVYGVSFTGNLTVQVGDNLGDLESLSDMTADLSDNFITTFRDMPDAGYVSTPDGKTTVYTTPGDGEADVVMAVTDSEANSNFAIIVTDDQSNVLGLPPGNSVDLEGAGVGVCRVYGVSFTGELTVELGDNLAELDQLSTECFDLSDNFITAIRSVVDGGMVATPGGETTVYTCPGDGIMDVVEAVSTSESTANYAIIVTDSERNVLGLPPGLSVDLEGAGVGICRVYGVSFTGSLTVQVGDNLGDLESLSDMSADLSDNFITAFRDMPDAGYVSTPDGATTVYTTPGDGEADVVMAVTNSEANSNFAIIVTDDQGNVLGLPPGNSVDFEGAGVGVCRIYGVSFTGELTVNLGDNLGKLRSLSDECFALSHNFITVVRSEVDGGKVSTSNGDTKVNTCPGDGVADILEFSTSSTSTANYAYIITDNNGNVLGLPETSADFEGAGPGICRVYGASYTGNLTIQIGDNLRKLTSVSDGLTDLSDNFIQVVRRCNQHSSVNMELYPNPARSTVQLNHSGARLAVQVLDARGHTLINRKFDTANPQLDVSELPTGIYIVLLDDGQGAIQRMRLIKN